MADIICEQPLMVGDGTSSRKTDYVSKLIPNPEGHHNRITGSRVMGNLLNGWIFPIGQSGEASRPTPSSFFKKRCQVGHTLCYI